MPVLEKILPGVDLHAFKIAIVKDKAKRGKILKNPLQTQNHEHPEIRAYRNKVSKEGRFLAQAHLKNIQAQVIDPKELRSSQDIVYREELRYFLRNPEQINRRQLTRRYGTVANGFREYAIVGVTSDGKKFVIDGNHRISAAARLHKKVKVKILDLGEFLYD